MKKSIALLFLVFMLLMPSAFAAAPPKNMVIMDAKSNHSFVSVRFVNGFDGSSIEWDEASKRIGITHGSVHIAMTLGQKSALVNDKAVTLQDAPFRDNGSIYVPLQILSKELGYKLEWLKTSNAVKISTEKASSVLPVVTRTAGQALPNPVVSEKKTFKVGGKSFNVQMVTVSLMHPQVQMDVVLAGNTPGMVEDLSSIAKRSGATVAINGTFFDAYTTGSYKAPYGYILSKGAIKMASSGDQRVIFTYDENQLASLISGADFQGKYNQGLIEGGLQAGPRLIVDGKVSLNVKQEGFKDPKILTGGGARSALGITKDHKLILLTTGGATIPQLAEIMREAGAYQAMNLDGGASSGLYYNGKYLTTPGRKISNAIVIKVQ
ncbi:phosphodiester glycosidase family protein [Paenibacillus sp. KQZ6P-2]|uniref:Phosphodiester glycosidase family protein n=1 Tax=Paenibacillus mangrovi TaxID=2931978 RepID=A0A9X1WT15_9BACL|nr:phosphodiester glycosidase family protein [Paenibacillus mangrovi]MCJ8014061.1 phosphodiester glycosidase family protein [Paenibacillus mangrovi]